MKILILGSEGFIGSHCKKYFTAKGYEVYSADIVLKDEPLYFLINAESANYSTIFSQHQFNVCINATGAANVQFSFTHPHTDYFLNTANVYAILDAIRLFNPDCAFINLSSAAVYGNPQSLPISEHAAVQPTSPYGLHKLYSEQICNEFYRFFGIKTLSLRIFSAYGPGLKKQLFWDLYQKAKVATHSITVYGTGNETRDFIYINDLVHAIDCVIQQNSYSGNAINVATGTATTIKEVVTIFLQLYKPNLALHFSGEEKKGDPLFWQADIGLLMKLNFVQHYSLSEGLDITIHWLRQQ